jgi:pyridoxine 5-phosphate synthase
VPPKLSVNVNKVATVRNSRGGRVPNLIHAVRVCIDAGAHGITVHPRADERHITRADVYEVARELQNYRGRIEYNIEGDPRPDWLALVHEVKPHQATLVPVMPGEVTSHVGYTRANTPASLRDTIAKLQDDGIRVSLFIDTDLESVAWAAELKAKRVELYTEPFARAFEQGEAAARASYGRYVRAAMRAAERGLEVNAGHDLDHENLVLFRDVPHLAEVSIGHALISRAIFEGLHNVVREYLDVLDGAAKYPASVKSESSSNRKS